MSLAYSHMPQQNTPIFASPLILEKTFVLVHNVIRATDRAVMSGTQGAPLTAPPFAWQHNGFLPVLDTLSFVLDLHVWFSAPCDIEMTFTVVGSAVGGAYRLVHGGAVDVQFACVFGNA